MSLARFRAQALVYIVHFRHERLRPNLRWRPYVPLTMSLDRMPDAASRQEQATVALAAFHDEALAEISRGWPGLSDPTARLDAVVDAVRGLVSLPSACTAPNGRGNHPDEDALVEAERRCFAALSLLPDHGAARAVRMLLEAAGRIEALPGSLGDAATFAAREAAERRCRLAEELSAAKDLARAAGLGGVVAFAEWDLLVGQFVARLQGLLPLREGDGALAECRRAVLDLRRSIEDLWRGLEGAPPAAAAAAAVLEDEALLRRARTNFAGADVGRVYGDLVKEYRQTRDWTATAYQQAVEDVFNRCVNRPGGELPAAPEAPHLRQIATSLSVLGHLFCETGLGALWARVDEAATFQLNIQAYAAPPEAAACHEWAARLVGRALAGELTEADIRQTWEEVRLRGSLGMAGLLLRGLAGEHPLAYRAIPVALNGISNGDSTMAPDRPAGAETDDEITRDILAVVAELRGQDPRMKITQNKIAKAAVCSPGSVKMRTPTLKRQGRLIHTRRLGFDRPKSSKTDPNGP